MGSTVRRGTKRHEAILASATNIQCHSSDSYFRGVEMREDDPNRSMPPRDWLRHELDLFRNATLQHDGDNRYTLYVHSNLWFKFEA